MQAILKKDRLGPVKYWTLQRAMWHLCLSYHSPTPSLVLRINSAAAALNLMSVFNLLLNNITQILLFKCY